MLRNAIVVFFVWIVFASGSLPGYANEIPGGSWINSCHNAHMDGPYLTALCGRGNGGGERWNRVFIPRCGRSGVSNQGGHLVCGGYYR